MTWLVGRGSAPLVVAVAVACGSDGGTGPVPCDTYTGGIVSGALPGTYELVSFCQGQKPNLVPPAATGTVNITHSDFTAAITVQGQPTAISGTYTTIGQAITVTLSGVPAQFAGTFRLRNDTLAVSGVVGTLQLSLVGTRTTP
ncbi:MAG TPA: hypothetical protein VFU41_10810 [Gemmatimonadales bacterium]|nr:hypothetical protein [Gemmatimonadales bacterium]